MPSHTVTSHLRRRASREGLKIVKLREGSRWYAQYGPIMLVDADTNEILAWGLSSDEVKAELDQPRT